MRHEPEPAVPRTRPVAETSAHAAVAPTSAPTSNTASVASPAASHTAALAPKSPSDASTTSTASTEPEPTVTLPSSAARYLNNPPPAYPRLSRRVGEQGTVIVHARIDVQGRAQGASIGRSSGYPRLDQAALAAVQRWRFAPGTRAGVPEAMWVDIPIPFVLE